MQWLLGLFLIASTAAAIAQQDSQGPDRAILPDAPSHIARKIPVEASAQPTSAVTSFNAAGTGVPSLVPISRRYLNFSDSTGGRSESLIFVGGNSASNADAGQAASASGANCGRSSAAKSNGSDWINSILAVTSHKGGRYCALGEGGFWKRGTYAASRAFIAHRYDGAGSFNASELLGPGTASAMPGSYYAYPNYTGQRLAARFASSVGRDTLKNMFSEFWPDFATHVLRRRP